MFVYPSFLDEMTSPGSSRCLEGGQNPGVVGQDTWSPEQGIFLLLAVVQQ